MEVIAVHTGFYKGARRRPGARFEMDESAMKKGADGKPVLPRWVVAASGDAERQVAEIKRREENKILAGAKASAGNPKKVVEVAGDPSTLV